MKSKPLFENTFILRWSRVAIFADINKMLPCLLNQSLKTQNRSKELEFIDQYAVYICIS